MKQPRGIDLALAEFRRRQAIIDAGGNPDVMPDEAWEKVVAATLKRFKQRVEDVSI